MHLYLIYKMDSIDRHYPQHCTGREARTPDTWFWRPVLYQLSYSRVFPCAKVRNYFGITGIFCSFFVLFEFFDVLPS